MIRNTRHPSLYVKSLEVFTRSSPSRSRVNEDSWFVYESPRRPSMLIFGVIDGAGVRRELPSLINGVRETFPNSTAASFASYVLKSSLLDQFRKTPGLPLQIALVRANSMLRNKIRQIVGTFSPTKILSETDESLRGDLRNIRLVLPACVVTVARLNLASGALEFAHVGDTSLFDISHDNSMMRYTTDQMGKFDEIAFDAILDLKNKLNLSHFEEAVNLPEGRRFIIESGLRLNYVDVNGKTDPQQGCGVINGLSEVVDYIEAGVIKVDLDQTLGFCVLSDGLELLAPLNELPRQKEERYHKMAQIIRSRGLLGLYNTISRVAETDSKFDNYPRTKLQDDATGIYLQLGSI